MTGVQTCVTEMDDGAPAVCDLCSTSLGSRKDIKHVESPEAVSIAVRNGYRPKVMIQKARDELDSVEEDKEVIKVIIKATFESWVEMVHKSETPWALCDTCYEELGKYKGGKQ